MSDEHFGRWRAARLPWLLRDMATNFIRVYSKFGEQNNSVHQIIPTVLYALAAPSTPESAGVTPTGGTMQAWMPY